MPFGSLATGEEVDSYTLANGGLVVEILTYGGIVRRVLAPDRDGRAANVVLGLESLDDYAADNSPYLGAIVGRYANRLADATFELDGTEYHVTANEGGNSIHGGAEGFDRRVWRATELRDDCGVALAYTSPDGEMGYPGTLSVVVTYSLSDEGTLRIDYEAETDAPTIVNLTNHSYWNLGGEGSGPVDDHVLRVAASAQTPYGPGLIPTGEIEPVAGTALDFAEPAPLGRGRVGFAHSAGYDAYLVLDRRSPDDLEFAAELHDPASGRTLTVRTTEPGIQLYDGHKLDGSHEPRSGVALETMRFPDAVNRPAFPSPILRPGEIYRSTTEYRLS
jgi:aldose 1-epimerase